MAQWGNQDIANDAPVFTTNAANGASGVDEYGVSVFGYDTSEVSDTGLASPGWVRVVAGTGKVTGLTIVTGGTAYDNADTITVDDGTTATIETDGSGVITSLTVTLSDAETEEVPDVVITTSTGSGADIAVETEGRIGRVYSETIVAMKNIT